MNKTSKSRTIFLFFFFCILFSILALHLYGLQVRQHTFFTELGNRQYFLTLTTYPPRGLILDRKGMPLALNKDSISAFVMPHQIKNKPQLLAFLKKHFPPAVKRLAEKKQSYFMYVKRKITPEEQALIKSEAIEDIHFLHEPSRFYPFESATTITGITNIDNQGLFGIELLYNTQLAGTPTVTLLEKDARSGLFYFSQKTKESGVEGKDVQLTIDGNLQFLVQEELLATIAKFNALQGAAIVMNPETGEILAMASYPMFDPNNTTEIDQALTKNLAVTESYEFGSAFKAFAALAAFEEKVATPDETIDCENTKTAYVDGRRINTTIAHGLLTFSEVVQWSNNIGIAKVAKRVDTKLYDHYKKIGFGSKTNISFPGEQSGFLNHPRNWSKQSIISLSYGYEVSTTLLRLATSFCLFANDGYLISPLLILHEEPATKPKKIYSSETIKIMRKILEETASIKGSARHAEVKGYVTMGKTSTANLLENGHYNPNKNMYGFVGIIEKGSYKRVIACFVKESPQHDLYAATVAAPLFERIAEKTLLNDKIW